MTVWEMSLTGGIMVVVVFLVRSLLLHRLPKKTFVILWGIVALRLLIPVRIPSQWSFYSLWDASSWNGVSWNVSSWGDSSAASGAHGQGVWTDLAEDGLRGLFAAGGAEPEEQNVSQKGGTGKAADGNVGAYGDDGPQEGMDQAGMETQPGVGFDADGSGAENKAEAAGRWAGILWRGGSLLCAGYFVAAYFHCRRRFSESLPVKKACVEEFLAAHRLRRKVSVRCLWGIRAPLTYGVWRPVILFPAGIDWEDRDRTEFMLTHEYVHIRHFDAVLKCLMIAALCVHWFNPLVWALYIQCNRDIELSCDETVVHLLGRQSRGSYAMTLISMAEKKSLPMPLYNGFSENVLEERIESIMLTRKKSLGIGIAAAVLVAVVAFVFATSGKRVDAGAPEGETQGGEPLIAAPADEQTPDEGTPNLSDGAPETSRDSEISRNQEVGMQAVGAQADGAPDDEPVYAIRYMAEGMPVEIPARPVTGNGYRMLFPEDERLTYEEPLGFRSEANENVFLRVVLYAGLDAGAVEELLRQEGYEKTESGVYRMRTDRQGEACQDNILLVEDVYSTYGVNYAYPDLPEYEEGWGTFLNAVAETFLLNTDGLSADGEALKEAAIAFGDAYFAGDGNRCLETLSSEADESCRRDLERGNLEYTGAQAKRLCMGSVEEIREGEQVELQIECSNPEPDEGNIYLDLVFRKENGVMRVVFFGWDM